MPGLRLAAHGAGQCGACTKELESSLQRAAISRAPVNGCVATARQWSRVGGNVFYQLSSPVAPALTSIARKGEA